MPNVTISIEEELLKAGREYAKAQRLSLNGLIRKLLRQTVRHPRKDWLNSCFDLMDKAEGNSKGLSWTREELYDGKSIH